MKAVDFSYLRPTSVSELCRQLADAGGEAKIIAGGQTLVPLLAMRLARPALLLDINRLEELRGIVEEPGRIVIRAATRQAAVLGDETIRRSLPLLAKALRFVGHPQTRNRGTIGGSLANADPAAEIGLAVLTLDGEIVARSSERERVIPIRDFFLGPMTTALAPEACLMAVRLPIWPDAGSPGTGFQEVSIRQSDFALAAAAAQLVLDKDGVCRRVALSVGGAGATPLRVDAADRLLGTRLAEDDIAAVSRQVEEAVEAIADMHASSGYRRRIAGAVAARALTEAKADALARRS